MYDYPKLIKQYREMKLLTQDDLAKILGTNYVCVSRWERGTFEPSMKMKRKLMVLFAEAGMKIE